MKITIHGNATNETLMGVVEFDEPIPDNNYDGKPIRNAMLQAVREIKPNASIYGVGVLYSAKLPNHYTHEIFMTRP